MLLHKTTCQPMKSDIMRCQVSDSISHNTGLYSTLCPLAGTCHLLLTFANSLDPDQA